MVPFLNDNTKGSHSVFANDLPCVGCEWHTAPEAAEYSTNYATGICARR